MTTSSTTTTTTTNTSSRTSTTSGTVTTSSPSVLSSSAGASSVSSFIQSNPQARVPASNNPSTTSTQTSEVSAVQSPYYPDLKSAPRVATALLKKEELDSASSSSSSYSPPSSFSLVSVPASVVALHKKFRLAQAASQSPPALLEPPNPDYKAYVLVDSNVGGRRSASRRSSTQQRLKNSTSSGFSAIRLGFRKAFRTATRIEPTTTVAVAPSSVIPPPLSSSLPTGAPSDSLPASFAAAPSGKFSSSLPLVVALVAYIHQSPVVVARSLADMSSPLFILAGAGGSKHRKVLPTPLVLAPGDKAPGQQTPPAKAFDSSDEDHFMPHDLSRSPSSGSLDDDDLSSERHLLLYKKLRETGVSVAELICRLVVVVGAGGKQALMFFEPVEEQALDESARARLSEKRSDMVQRGFNVVSGRETGCLIMVRNDDITMGRGGSTNQALHEKRLRDDSREPQWYKNRDHHLLTTPHNPFPPSPPPLHLHTDPRFSQLLPNRVCLQGGVRRGLA